MKCTYTGQHYTDNQSDPGQAIQREHSDTQTRGRQTGKCVDKQTQTDKGPADSQNVETY
jgi:hypothetical protein